MSEQRLVDLAVLSIEHNISKSLLLDEIVDNFASQDRNRKILLTNIFCEISFLTVPVILLILFLYCFFSLYLSSLSLFLLLSYFFMDQYIII